MKVLLTIALLTQSLVSFASEREKTVIAYDVVEFLTGSGVKCATDKIQAKVDTELGSERFRVKVTGLTKYKQTYDVNTGISETKFILSFLWQQIVDGLDSDLLVSLDLDKRDLELHTEYKLNPLKNFERDLGLDFSKLDLSSCFPDEYDIE